MSNRIPVSEIRGKYVVFNDNSVLLFPMSTNHDFVARERLVISAGFFEVLIPANDPKSMTIKTWGSSMSLNKNSREEDSKLIAAVFSV